MIDFVGWAGNILLGLCAVPSAVWSLVTKRSPTPWTLLAPWFSGEVLALSYMLLQKVVLWPAVLNYAVNIAALVILIGVKARAEL